MATDVANSVSVIVPEFLSLTSEEQDRITTSLQEILASRQATANVSFPSWTQVVEDVLSAEEQSFELRSMPAMGVSIVPHRS